MHTPPQTPAEARAFLRQAAERAGQLVSVPRDVLQLACTEPEPLTISGPAGDAGNPDSEDPSPF